MISIASAEFLETVQRLFVVSIVSAAGLIIPKTSSRAITSPAGTADTMEAITNVSLELSEMKRVVEETGACLSWGGAVNLSPADDLLIRIERALELDGEGQLIASVLSKKSQPVQPMPLSIYQSVIQQKFAVKLKRID
tara:strand:+ start:116 stop:529 length:414 start_codon:yes stop_codon:yes gene_type:complete